MAVFALATDTGWSRDFCLWEISYPELLIWQHCQHLAAGEWTIEPNAQSSIAAQGQALENFRPDEGEFQV